MTEVVIKPPVSDGVWGNKEGDANKNAIPANIPLSKKVSQESTQQPIQDPADISPPFQPNPEPDLQMKWDEPVKPEPELKEEVVKIKFIKVKRDPLMYSAPHTADVNPNDDLNVWLRLGWIIDTEH